MAIIRGMLVARGNFALRTGGCVFVDIKLLVLLGKEAPLRRLGCLRAYEAWATLANGSGQLLGFRLYLLRCRANERAHLRDKRHM